MDIKKIQAFLADIAVHNNRDWFQEHKGEYQEARGIFEQGVEELLRKLSVMDPEVSHLSVKDCTYRFNRDTRFSPDKSPYKRHLGAYICAKGRKALRGGYYFHLQPGNCLVAVGCYWLPTNILTSCRNEIMANIDRWRDAVENDSFRSAFGLPNKGEWDGTGVASDKGFGLMALKTCPKGFPKDYEFIHYLRMKDYCCWQKLPEELFLQPDWADKIVEICRVGKPMMDMINEVVDDYE